MLITMRCLSIYAAISLALVTPVFAQGKWIDLPSNEPGTISSDNSDTACLDSRARLRDSTCATFEVDDDGHISTGSGDSRRWLHVDDDTEALELVSGEAPVGHWKGIKTVSPETTGLLSVFGVKKTAPQAPNYGPNWEADGGGGYIKLKEWDGGRGGHHKQLRFTVNS